jgi:hypothetical protein
VRKEERKRTNNVSYSSNSTCVVWFPPSKQTQSLFLEMTGFDEVSSYRVTLSLEPEDVWNVTADGPEPAREYQGSPEELRGKKIHK